MQGAYLAIFVLLCESVPPSLRAFVGTCDEIMWSIGIMTLPIIAYFVKDWRLLQIVISLPLVIVFTYFWYVLMWVNECFAILIFPNLKRNHPPEQTVLDNIKFIIIDL